MIQACKEIWRQLNGSKPGQRFQERYWRRRTTASGRLKKCAVILIGVLVVAAGLVLIPAPGPGMLIVIVGASLIAQESLAVARLLDRTEVRLRNVIKRPRA